MPKINYYLNGGYWAPKDEVKEVFYTDLYNFVNSNYDTELKDINLNDFISSEPYIIGNLLGKYFLKEEVGGKIENQPSNYFVGYCYHNNKYIELISHLERFFALWREIEGCSEANATDFYASSWASLVDTAKFFKYTTVEELEKSPEAPQVRDQRILYMLQNCPGIYFPKDVTSSEEDVRLPKPRKDGYRFIGWYDNSKFEGNVYTHASMDSVYDSHFYARWETYTYFHSNDGYTSFEELYIDFINDFSDHLGFKIETTSERLPSHGPVSEFCRVSYGGKLNSFFENPTYYNKWIWLINYLKDNNKNNPEQAQKFEYKDGKFGLEAQVRWELNSLFVKRFHLVWPKTRDYSGNGIKEKVADSTNSRILKVSYPVGEVVELPIFERKAYAFNGWYTDPKANETEVAFINDDAFATKTLYAKWIKVN